MLGVIEDVAVSVVEGSDTVRAIIAEPYDFGTIVNGANSVQMQVNLQFPATFTQTDSNEGLHNARFYVQNLRYQEGITIVSALSSTAVPKSAAALGSSTPVPRTQQDVTNFPVGTYWNNTDKSLEYLSVQMQTASGALTWDQNKVPIDDPQLVIEFNRGNANLLDAESPVGNSDHMWNYSQVDLYMHYKSPNGQIGRFKVGWCPDEDFDCSMMKETVEALKGKPTATAVEFYSKINALAKGSLWSTDPYLIAKASSIAATIVNGYIVYKETNKSRPRATFEYSIEWRLNGGQICRFIIPKGMIKFTEGWKPGGNDIYKAPFEIKPLVNSSGEVCRFEVSQSPVQQIIIPFVYKVT